MSFTQPICVDCWNELHPDRQVVGLQTVGHCEDCCLCGRETRHGIYFRVDPTTVPYPQKETE